MTVWYEMCSWYWAFQWRYHVHLPLKIQLKYFEMDRFLIPHVVYVVSKYTYKLISVVWKGWKLLFVFSPLFFIFNFHCLCNQRIQREYHLWSIAHTRYTMVSCRLRFTAKILGDKGNLKLNVNKVFKYVIPKCELLMNEVRFKLFGVYVSMYMSHC